MTTKECGHCGGTGFVWWDEADSSGEHRTGEVPCPACCDGWAWEPTDPEEYVPMDELVNGRR